jgi:DNA (cytosine-5)-methyltransferase 1
VGASKKMVGLELFAGAGGMSLGASLAGIEVQTAIEIKPSACATYRANHPKTKLLATDIRSVSEFQLTAAKREVVVFGGPPCQGFSTSNQRTRNRDNDKNWLFLEFLRVVRTVRPQWVVFENVAGIVQTDKGYFVSEFNKRLRRLVVIVQTTGY